MIAYLKGSLAVIEPTHAIIECGGIGYLVKISLNTYSQIRDKKEVKLHTHFWVREDNQTLFGFAKPQEQQLFELLIGISGVGGNTAMTILSSISASDLVQAVQGEDVATLKRVKGIGAKTAGRIILELKDKIQIGGIEGKAVTAAAGGSSLAHKKQEASAALMQLGFPRTEVNKRVDRILREKGESASVEEIIKLALRNN
ncbi:MAG: Holliday junction branch migration protein RuvA [Bacteroidota bacterium]